MRESLFGDSIRVRAEPGLRDAINAAARKERTTASEFLRRELRGILSRRGLPPEGPQASQGAAS